MGGEDIEREKGEIETDISLHTHIYIYIDVEREKGARRERLLGKFSSGVLVGGSVRPFNGQVCTAKATSSNSHFIDGACKL